MIGFLALLGFYPSSKTCGNCGWINQELKLSDRVWVCENCKKEIDRDANAALNIRDYGIRFNPVNAKVVH